MKILFAGVLIILMAACPPLSTGLRKTTKNPAQGYEQLVVAQFPEKRELGRYPLGENPTFSLAFIHSVSKTPVIDVYEIRKGRIVQTKEIFETHGAGLPSGPEEPWGYSWEKTDGHFIFHMQRPISKLIVRTDRFYQNRLIIGCRIINLNRWEMGLID